MKLVPRPWIRYLKGDNFDIHIQNPVSHLTGGQRFNALIRVTLMFCKKNENDIRF